MAGQNGGLEIDKAAEKLTDEIQSMTNYKNLYNEIQVGGLIV